MSTRDPATATPAPPARPAPPRPAAGVGTTVRLPGAADAPADRSRAGHPGTGPRADPEGPFPRVPGYEILRTVGRGGMGVVYEARQVELDRRVALKMLCGERLADPELRDRLRAEAEVIARLQHPNIIQVFEVGTADRPGDGTAPGPFLALEFVDGGSLDQRDHAVQVPRDAARTVRVLAHAAHAAHQVGVVHRDLKPANVLLTKGGEPKIADFGIAKRIDHDSRKPDPAWTRAGTVLGTVEFLPPEYIRGGAVSPAIDVYALGVILYELLTGRVPFQGATLADTIVLVLDQDPVPPRRLQPGVPRDLETICLKCLEKDPGRRYPSARALGDDLDRWARGEPIAAREVTRAERAVKLARRNPVAAAAAAAVVLVLATAAAVSTWFAVRAGTQAAAARAAEHRAEERAEAEARAKERAEYERGRADDAARTARGAEARAADGAERATAERRRAEAQLDRSERLLYASKMSSAQAAFGSGNVELGLQYLGECPWDLRGWEHRHLRTRVSSEQTLRGHAGTVAGAAWAPDGGRIVTASSDATARVWDADTGRQRLVLKGHTDRVVSASFSPDGARIVTAGSDATARVWDAGTGRQRLVLKVHTGTVEGAAWSPDGGRIVTAGHDATARVWDADTGRLLLTLRGHTDGVTSAAWSPDGTRIVTAGSDATARVWEVPPARPEGGPDTGRLLLTLKGHTDGVTSAAWSPDGTRIVTAGTDATARVWEVPAARPEGVADAGRLLLTLKGHTGGVMSAAWSPDGARIVTAGSDATAKVWDAPTARPEGSPESGPARVTLSGHTGPVTGAAFSPDGTRIVTASTDAAAKVWDANRGPEPCPLTGHTMALTGAAWSPDGTRIVTAGHDATAKVWKVPSARPDGFTGRGHESLTLTGHALPIRSASFSPDGARIVTASFDATARVWDADTGRVLLTFTGHTGYVMGACFSPDGTRIVTAGFDAAAKVRDANTGRVLLTLTGHTRPIESAWFSPDGGRIVTAGHDATARVWDANTGRPLLTLSGHIGPVTGAAFSPDGTRIVTASSDATARVWDAYTGRELFALRGHTRAVTAAAFSPDGTRIVTASSDATARIWDADRGDELLTLKGHALPVTGASFSPDGSRLVTAGHDATANVWFADKGPALLVLTGHTEPVRSVAFSPDGTRVFAWDGQKRVLAWSAADGKRVPAVDPPPAPAPGPTWAPDGSLRAAPRGTTVRVSEVPRLTDAGWKRPGAAERTEYHSRRAALAEKAGQWFAAAFHLGRLLLDAPGDADLARRRDAALKKHGG